MYAIISSNLKQDLQIINPQQQHALKHKHIISCGDLNQGPQTRTPHKIETETKE